MVHNDSIMSHGGPETGSVQSQGEFGQGLAGGRGRAEARLVLLGSLVLLPTGGE